MFSSGEASTLGTALTSVRRRVTFRRAAFGALAGAALAAAPAYLLSSAWLAPAFAAAGAWAATRRRALPASAWLDAADRDDLVLTAAALIDHRARATDLASIVVTSAADRAHRVRPPSLTLAALALAATAALIMIPIAGPEQVHGTRSAGTTVRPSDTAVPGPSAVRGTAAAVRGTSAVGGTAEAAAGTASAPDEVLRTYSPQAGRNGGHGEGAGAALRGAVEGEAATAVAASDVETAAAVAGAAPDVAAVPARYRGIVAAYLGAR